MPNLSEILGAIMTSVAEARQIADEQTIRVAARYQQEELLQGMSIPRFRLPEIEIELPVVVEAHDPAQPEEIAKTTDVLNNTRTYLKTLAQTNENLAISDKSLNEFSQSMETQLKKNAVTPTKILQSNTKEDFVKAGEEALLHLSQLSESPLSQAQVERIKPLLRDYISRTAVVKPARSANLRVLVETEKVKKFADSNNKAVVHLRLSLREEGLEWSELQYEGGQTKARLIPE